MTVQTLITKTQNTILSAALIISISTGLSAVLGVVKNRLLAHQFGVSNELAVFYTADYIPSLLYSVLIVGAISTVFIPIFTSQLSKDRETAFRTASTIINATLASFLVIGTIIFLLSTPIFKLVSLNQFSAENTLLGSNLMRVMVLSQMLLVCGSLATSVLQSFKYFLIPALAPVVYNLGMILGIIFLAPSLGIYGPAIGLLIGATFHFLIQIPMLKKTGFKFYLLFNSKDENFKKILTLIPPRVTSVLIANLIQTVNNSFAILISTSSVIALKFANQLQGFPINLFGFSIAAASLPTLSAEGGEKNLDNFKKTFLTSFHQMMFLVVPLSMILFILRVPIVRIVYGVSNFPWETTVETASVLAIFSFSIFAQSANYLITRSFYALKDTMTPVLVAVGTSIINVSLSTFLIVILKYNVWAVAFSYSLTSIFDTLILLYLLDKKIGTLNTKDLFTPFLKISTSAFLMGLTLYIPVKLLDQVIFDTTRTINLLILTLIAGVCGVLTYLLFTKVLKVEEISLLYKIAGKLRLSKKEVNIELPGYSEKPAE
jgi:putative peptidoglycan lipid II flippase